MALRLASLPLRGAAVAARFAVPASARSVALQSPARIPAVLGVARRHMSAPAGGLPPWLTITNIRKYAPQIGMAAGAIVVVYGISRIMMHVTTSILSLDMYDVFYYGFGTGLAATLVFGAGAAYLAKQLTISSRVAVNKALAKVQASPAVTAALGNNVRLGMLRSYVTHTGHVSLASKKSFAWVEPRALFLFEVNGEKGDAFVHGEAVKHRGKYAFNVLAVDTLARKGGPAPQLVILKGDAEKLKRKGYLRGFLQTDRAMFIEQTAVEDDDARVAAQADLQPEEEAPPSAARGAASSAAAGASAAAPGGGAGPSSSQMR